MQRITHNGLNLLVAILITLPFMWDAKAERLKDISTIQGVRQNQLVGYGLVVGLDGTGEQISPYTTQSLINMLQQMGVNLPPNTAIIAKNVAAVMVTSNLPAFAQPGQTIDVTVSSAGSAKSLRGGTLVMTPLKGADGQVYAIAQGNLVVGGVGASANGSSAQVNHLSVGRISSGATVERALPNPLAGGSTINLELTTTDFSTASMVVDAINQKFGPNTAAAQDGRVIRVKAPQREDEKVAFLAALESTNVTPDKTMAKVIMNARTGSVVMTQHVTLESCAVSHGNLSVVINTAPVISQPGPLSNGNTVATQVSNVSINKDPGKVLLLESGTSLADVVKALNSIGATPQDLLAILQAMKAAGSFKAELEII